MRKRVLVTGGAGFIGSHLCDSLLADGHRILCMDNLSTGSLHNVEHLLDDPRFDFIHHDVTDPLEVEVDEIYNLACPASPAHYQRDPVQTIRTSVLGANHLLELARRRRITILQASTSEVYGDPAEHPQAESYWGNVNPVGPRSCYNEGKRCAEALFLDYRRQHGVDTKVARIFNTYGPRMQAADGRVVSNFVVQALLGQDITIYGDGRQTRSFCYVDDLVSGLRRLMATPAAVCGPVNLGSTDERGVLELALRIVALTGAGVGVVRGERPDDDPCQRKPDVSLAERLLDWRPRVDLDDGLSRTIAYFRSVLAEEPGRPSSPSARRSDTI